MLYKISMRRIESLSPQEKGELRTMLSAEGTKSSKDLLSRIVGSTQRVMMPQFGMHCQKGNMSDFAMELKLSPGVQERVIQLLCIHDNPSGVGSGPKITTNFFLGLHPHHKKRILAIFTNFPDLIGLMQGLLSQGSKQEKQISESEILHLIPQELHPKMKAEIKVILELNKLNNSLFHLDFVGCREAMCVYIEQGGIPSIHTINIYLSKSPTIEDARKVLSEMTDMGFIPDMNTTRVFLKRFYKGHFLQRVSSFHRAKEIVSDMMSMRLQLDIGLMNAYLARAVLNEDAQEVLIDIKRMGIEPNAHTVRIVIQGKMHECFRRVFGSIEWAEVLFQDSIKIKQVVNKAHNANIPPTIQKPQITTHPINNALEEFKKAGLSSELAGKLARGELDGKFGSTSKRGSRKGGFRGKGSIPNM